MKIREIMVCIFGSGKTQLHRERATTKRSLQRRHAGQNLVELVLTLPMIFVLIFFIVDLSRAWMTYESAKLAAREGAYVASIYHNPQVGQGQMVFKLNAAGLTAKNAKVTQVPNQHAYQADVTVTYQSVFGDLQIPVPGGSISLIPAEFDVGYKAITDVSIY